MPNTPAPFSAFFSPIREQSALRTAITAAYRRPETDCISELLPHASLSAEQTQKIAQTARKLIEGLRAAGTSGGVQGLVQEYTLSSQEGVALMCLAEALLRIPDAATRDALIRDKIADGDWASHLGGGRSVFVNASTWGLVVTGKLTSSVNDRGLGAALTRLIARAGEPIIRKGVDMAMRMMGEQFVTGETIDEAVERAAELEAKGFGYSYDMLGEAATTAADAERYFQSYKQAIHAIGKASNGRGVYAGPGISIKLSALHPRYSRSQAERVMDELLPRVTTLCVMARGYNIGLNIDAEEADRLELSLDLLESLALDPQLSNWDGLGFVVQAYGKRCPFVLDWIIDLAKRANRRIMVRLVKGAYWDAEIKRAQVDGLPDFPVYTRKVHTDVSYVACARKLLANTDHIFPQFASHNAQTLATIYHLAGPDFHIGKYEFQCLHGMGEPLYSQVVGEKNLNRPCRIYAPVGTHETLLAYLVRRLLENGANSSFVNRIADPDVSVEELIVDPVSIVLAEQPIGAPHDQIAKPADILAPRLNSAGLDLSNEVVLSQLASQLQASASRQWEATPTGWARTLTKRTVTNPSDRNDLIGMVSEVAPEDVGSAAVIAQTGFEKWSVRPVTERAACLLRAADIMQSHMAVLLGLIAREAGKSLPNAIAEVREAIDFLRYYAEEATVKLADSTALGPIACISPWNFPLAIFTGQIAAALAAGNSVLAKPAEETPLIAAEAVRILHEAGVPEDALLLVLGDGAVGGALVAAPQVAGVMFTGSTEVAQLINRNLASRAASDGRSLPLIAETGGQNAMIVDSSALAEQVVGDVIASAFDSAGQRCSALRILCLQEDVADYILTMLKGALQELSVGNTDKLSVDVGPVISTEAQQNIEKHIEMMEAAGNKVHRLPLPAATQAGSFVAPTIIEISDIAQLKREVFGPVLHVVRYRRTDLDSLIASINATGYGLTFGLHTRLDETIAHVTQRVGAGNIYVNRNIIGAVVGVQPFGGRGLSGTGPKAGGPLYLGRLVKNPPAIAANPTSHENEAIRDFAAWLDQRSEMALAAHARAIAARSPLGLETELPGPVGERNLYSLHPRGDVLVVPQTQAGLYIQIAYALATGNRVFVDMPVDLVGSLANLPNELRARIISTPQKTSPNYAGVLVEGDASTVASVRKKLAEGDGPIAIVQGHDNTGQFHSYTLSWLVEEVSTSINTTAAGGNASLMTIA